MKENTENKLKLNSEETNKEQPKKNLLKGIICLIFGHDWVEYNEHCYICSRCMEVTPKG